MSGRLFQQNMATAMAFAPVRWNRSTFPAVTKGRKGISPTKLNTTGNRRAGSWMAWAPSCTKSNGNQPQRAGHWLTESQLDMVSGALLPRLNILSRYLWMKSLSCSWGIIMHERITNSGEKAVENGQGKARLCFFIGCYGFMLPSNSHLTR